MSNKAFKNGKIFTSDKDVPYAESFIVKDGIIIWIGNEKDMPEVNCETIDLQGRRVIPGFVDAHMHPVILADCAQKISCLPPVIRSIEELIEAIKEEATAKKPEEWIQGWGYDEEKFVEHRAPDRWDLDKASTEHPIELLRSCSHIRSVNRPDVGA